MQDPKHVARLPLAGSELPDFLLAAPSSGASPSGRLRILVRLVPALGEEALYARAEALGRQPLAERRYLGGGDLAAEIGPSAAAAEALAEFCRDWGLAIERRWLGGLCVTVAGAAEDLARAFDVQIAAYRHGGDTYRGYAGSIRLPSPLHPHVRAVLGLDEASRLAIAHARPASAELLAHPGNLPTTVAFEYYRFPRQYTGRGTTVAFLETDLAVDLEKVQAFFQKLGIGPVAIHLAFGSTGAASDPSDLNGEAMMDLKLTGAVAPGATLVAYGVNQRYGITEEPWTDALLAALDSEAYPCEVISISLGTPESQWVPQNAQTINFLFAIAGLRGITICIASGDFGAPGNPDGAYLQNCAFPASSPYCLSCGGTALILEKTDHGLELRGEVVWNEMAAPGQKLATGGGISMLFPVPPYQAPLTLPGPFNPGQPSGRGVPDVASNAALSSGYDLSAGPKPGDGYGTSAAAPIWAALMALIVESDPTQPPGWLNPLLYQLQLGGSTCCRPILEGDNGPPGDVVAFSAGAPWNACCGLGSPLGQNLLAALRPTKTAP